MNKLNESKALIAGVVIGALILVVAAWSLGASWGLTHQSNSGDINRDGVVDALDLSIVMSNWTK